MSAGKQSPGRLYQGIAEIISWIFNPAIFGIIIILVSLFRTPMNQALRISWFVSILVLNALIPFCIYKFLLGKGYIFDAPLARKDTQRNRLIIFLFFLLIVGLEVLILGSTTASQPLLVILTGGVIALILSLFLTYFWKISLHAGMATIFIAMLIYIYGLEHVWFSMLLLPLVFWARIILTRHTYFQLFMGVAAAILVILITFVIFRAF